MRLWGLSHYYEVLHVRRPLEVGRDGRAPLGQGIGLAEGQVRLNGLPGDGEEEPVRRLHTLLELRVGGAFRGKQVGNRFAVAGDEVLLLARLYKN